MEVDTNSNSLINPEPSTSTATVTSASASRLGCCEVCAFKEARYTCPRCEVKTCSLKCNKIHKLELECNGQRDKTKFVPLNKFTNLDLSSDYRLLEEISRSLEAGKKKFGYNGSRHFFPEMLFKLQKAAAARKVTLKFLPQKFARRSLNTTCFSPKVNSIFWHIEWIFVNADHLKFYDKKVSENEKLSSILDKYFTQEQDEKLQFYQAAGLSGIRLYLKAEQRKGKQFYELDMSLTLKECLRKKLIIEYPTIHVLLSDHGCGYNVIDSDDESEVSTTRKSGNEVLNGIIKNDEDDEESIYKSLKNLLFISEYSDEEMCENEQGL